jgi:uncharacterized protein YbcV (DUF1398 family)
MMTNTASDVARQTLDAAYAGTMDFPQIVRALMAAGYEGYDVDFRSGTATYFRPGGAPAQLALPTAATTVDIAASFTASVVERAVRAAQAGGPDYTYTGFCDAVKAAGCAGYMVSFLGRRVVYFGRTAETHVEHFPQ